MNKTTDYELLAQELKQTLTILYEAKEEILKGI